MFRILTYIHTYLLTYLLTYSMVQSPSWATNWFVASQEIPHISRNPKVHYRTHKRPPSVPILDQPNPVHIPTSHLLEIHLNIIHPSTPRSPQWSPFLRFPHQYPIHPSHYNKFSGCKQKGQEPTLFYLQGECRSLLWYHVVYKEMFKSLINSSDYCCCY